MVLYAHGRERERIYKYIVKYFFSLFVVKKNPIWRRKNEEISLSLIKIIIFFLLFIFFLTNNMYDDFFFLSSLALLLLLLLLLLVLALGGEG
jgi:hypothetical protein